MRYGMALRCRGADQDQVTSSFFMEQTETFPLAKGHLEHGRVIRGLVINPRLALCICNVIFLRDFFRNPLAANICTSITDCSWTKLCNI